MRFLTRTGHKKMEKINKMAPTLALTLNWLLIISQPGETNHRKITHQAIKPPKNGNASSLDVGAITSRGNVRNMLRHHSSQTYYQNLENGGFATVVGVMILKVMLVSLSFHTFVKRATNIKKEIQTAHSAAKLGENQYIEWPAPVAEPKEK